MIINLSSDWADSEDGEVRPDQILERIDELVSDRAECEAEGVAFPAEEAEELRLWHAFRAAVEKVTGGEFESATIVPEEDFDKTTRYCAEREYGIGVENLGEFIDWDRYARARRSSFTAVTLDGQTAWVR